MWQGEPIPDVGRLRDHPLLAELRREHAVAVLAFAEAAADLGAHEQALPALWTLAGNDPLNEKAHSLLMIALAAAGQQAEALRVFDQLRTRLDSELGVRPSPHLESAYLRVLRQQFTVSLRSPGRPAIRQHAAGQRSLPS
jgi:DNA-binding SARP family transcriptional activator